MAKRLQELAFLNPGLEIFFQDEREKAIKKISDEETEEISEVETAGQTTEGEIAEVQTTEGETADSEKNMNTNDFRHWCKKYHYEGGIRSYVEFLNQHKTSIHKDVVYIVAENQGVMAEVALQWTTSYNEQIVSFVNNINTIDGGTHVSGLKGALTRTFNNYLASDGKKQTKTLTLVVMIFGKV